MKLNSVVFKLGATILFLQLIILIPLGYIILQLILNYSINQTETQLVQLSEKYATQVNDLEDPENLQLLEHLTDMTDTSAVILDSNGNNLLETNWHSDITDQVLDDNEIKQLDQGETVVEEYTFNGSTYLKVAHHKSERN